MKKITIAALLTIVLFGAGIVLAQDPFAVGPNVYKRLAFENDRVRVAEISFNPGDKIAMHSHPDHFVYVLKDGTLKLSYPDGSSADFVGKAGDVAWIPAESHAAENVGSTEFKALVVELKDRPLLATEADRAAAESTVMEMPMGIGK